MDILKENRIFVGIAIGFLTSILILFSLSQSGILHPDSEEGGYGNTTIVSIYRQIVGMEIYTIYYYMDVEHRIYPDTITVPGSSSKVLYLEFTVNFDTPGDWNVQPSDSLKLEIEVPRMPSGCSIESYLDFLSDTGNREFDLTVTFLNTNADSWSVGRPMIKISNIELGQPNDPTDNSTPEVELFVAMNII